MDYVSACPGCGYPVFLPNASDNEFITWDPLPDGRFVGWLWGDEEPSQPFHECPHRGDGGGESGDRAPLPSTPPAQARSAEQDLPPG